VALPRRDHTEEPDEFLEINSETILAMSDQQLYDLLGELGITVMHQQPWGRDKMIDLIMQVALSAKDN
jgi:hypothetical protein